MLTNDLWTLDLDKLGMKATGDELARLILTCRPPYAICVQGKWGSGKTSLMRYAMARLGGKPLAVVLRTAKEPIKELSGGLQDRWDDLAKDAESYVEEQYRGALGYQSPGKLKSRVVPIWFNPWQHQDAPLPVVPLLQELRSQFTYLAKTERRLSNTLRTSIEAGLPILGELLDAFTAAGAGVKGGMGKAIGGIRQIAEANERRDFATLHEAQRVNLLFEAAVSRLLNVPKSNAFPFAKDGQELALYRVVIFIDDLDRCSESQAVHLMEAIKLYLSTPHCVFVLGMDGSAARRAVRTVLPHKSSEEAQEYLEKLFQAMLPVPLPRGSVDFLSELLGAAELEERQTGLQQEALARSIERLVEPNPRKIKNFVGSLAVGWRVFGATGSRQQDFQMFLLLTYLRIYHPDVYRLLAYDPNQVLGLNKVIAEVRKSGGLKHDAPPAQHFFHQALRHAFEVSFAVDDKPSRKDREEVVQELIERLDRHSGDRAFLDLWTDEMNQTEERDVAERVRSLLLGGGAGE